MNYTWATASHVGHLREENEDAVVPTDDGRGSGPLLVAIADGMGGHVAGEVASQLAIEAAAAPPAEASIDPAERVAAGNTAIVDASAEDPGLAGMGTTLTLALFDEEGKIHIGHVGDSRLYLLRDGVLRQLTTDHTWVTEMQARGQLSPEQAATHPRRHLLTRVLGMADVEIDEDELEVKPGDRVLLCSDGLTTMLADDTVRDLLLEASAPSDAVWALIEAANSAGGYDNTTVAVVDVDS